jgi:hypothetical protein
MDARLAPFPPVVSVGWQLCCWQLSTMLWVLLKSLLLLSALHDANPHVLTERMSVVWSCILRSVHFLVCGISVPSGVPGVSGVREVVLANLKVRCLNRATIVGTYVIPLLDMLVPIDSHMLMLSLLMLSLLMVDLLLVEPLLKLLLLDLLLLELLLLGQLMLEWLILDNIRAMLTSEWWRTPDGRANVHRMQSLRRRWYSLLHVARRARLAAVRGHSSAAVVELAHGDDIC